MSEQPSGAKRASGYVYYIKYSPKSRSPWQLWRHDVTNDIATLIFANAKPKESVAGSADGQRIIFILRPIRSPMAIMIFTCSMVQPL
ncbi:MAG: hypothetical protein R2865_15065 [Deinococcales bacterium]